MGDDRRGPDRRLPAAGSIGHHRRWDSSTSSARCRTSSRPKPPATRTKRSRAGSSTGSAASRRSVRIGLPDDDLHRPPGLEGPRRPRRIFDSERCLLPGDLPVGHLAWIGLGDSHRGRHGHRRLDRHRDHGAGVPGDATGTRPGGGVGLFPAIAGWGVLVLGQTLGAAGKRASATSSLARDGCSWTPGRVREWPECTSTGSWRSPKASCSRAWCGLR